MAIIKCRECSKEVSSSADKCPHCGVKLNSNSSIGMAIGIFVIFVAYVAYSNFGGKSSTITVSKPVASSVQQATSSNELTATNLKFFNDGLLSKVTGIVKNTTGIKLDYVQVEINLYDESGAQVGSTMTNVNNLVH